MLDTIEAARNQIADALRAGADTSKLHAKVAELESAAQAAARTAAEKAQAEREAAAQAAEQRVAEAAQQHSEAAVSRLKEGMAAFGAEVPVTADDPALRSAATDLARAEIEAADATAALRAVEEE